MTLLVYSARVSSRDPDRLDVTRKSGGKLGTPFAPSWPILRRALDTRRLDPERAWLEYVPAYLAEMRISKPRRLGRAAGTRARGARLLLPERGALPPRDLAPADPARAWCRRLR